MQISKLYNALVVLGASSAATGFLGCGGDDTGTGQGPVVGVGGASGSNGGGGKSNGGAPATGGAQNACATQCHTQANGWVFCNGSCCWLGSSDPCCN